MSYAFRAWSLDLATLRATARTPSAFARIASGEIERITNHDAQFIDCIEDGDPPLAEGLRRLLFGEDAPAYVLAYALELVCRHTGAALPNDGLTGIRWSWIERVDDALAAAGAPIRLANLSIPPIELPPVDDLPMIGFLTREEAAPLAHLSVHEDGEVEGAFASLRVWGRSGADVVTFYS